MTLSGSGDCEGAAGGGCGFPSESADLDADLGWIARVQDTAARFNESLKVTDEERDAASARLDAVMGRYHQFMGVSETEDGIAADGNAAIGLDEVGEVQF